MVLWRQSQFLCRNRSRRSPVASRKKKQFLGPRQRPVSYLLRLHRLHRLQRLTPRMMTICCLGKRRKDTLVVVKRAQTIQVFLLERFMMMRGVSRRAVSLRRMFFLMIFRVCQGFVSRMGTAPFA